jgi:putative methyltransferase (TIGR04325 family)
MAMNVEQLKSIARVVMGNRVYGAASSVWSRMRTPAPSSASPSELSQLETLHGYEADRLVDVVYAKTTALIGRDVSNFPGAERTMLGVLFAATQTSAVPLRVLDFGGACGFHYLASQRLGIPKRWAVVESPAMATRASSLETDDLRFFSTIDAACRWLGDVDFIHSSGTLQYIPKPFETLEQLLALSVPIILWSRMALTENAAVTSVMTSTLSANGPGPMPAGIADAEVNYSITRLPRTEFLRAHQHYRLVAEFGEPSVGFLFARSRH